MTEQQIENLVDDIASGWIPCSHRMPSFGVKLMVYNVDFGIQVAYLKPNRNGTSSWIVDEDPMLNVTHWRNMPAIPPSTKLKK